MHTVYVLRSLRDGKWYIGCTSRLNDRVDYHNKGRVKSTKHRRPFELIYQESYDNVYDAFNAERRYKSVKGRRELKDKMALSSNG